MSRIRRNKQLLRYRCTTDFEIEVKREFDRDVSEDAAVGRYIR